MGGQYSDRLVIIWSSSGPRDGTKQDKTARGNAKPKPLRDKGKRWNPLQVGNPCNDVCRGDEPLGGICRVSVLAAHVDRTYGDCTAPGVVEALV